MRTFELRTADGRCIARHVHLACSFRSRCIGLLRHASIPEHEGLLLVPGGTVHTLGMRFEIDVVFLNRQMRVLGFAERVAPWRIVTAPKETARVLELAAGKIATTRLSTGTYLIVDRPSDDPSERTTTKMPRPHRTPCERTPIQFSLRVPDARAVRSQQPYRPARDVRATTKPNVES
jgi:uncharacterized membrane protein (UPF0127 family)